MNLGGIAALKLDGVAALVTSAAGTELDLQKYFVNPGKRPMRALVMPIWTASDSGTATFNYKLQESNTTVDSDFSDISGASITAVTADAAATAFQNIQVYTNKRYIRGYRTISGGSWTVAATLLAVKRDG